MCRCSVLSTPPSLISAIWSLNRRIWRKVHRTFLMRPDRFARQYWEKNRKSTINKTICTWKNYDASCRSLNRENSPCYVFRLLQAKSFITTEDWATGSLSACPNSWFSCWGREKCKHTETVLTIYSEQVKLPNFFLTRVQYSIFWN